MKKKIERKNKEHPPLDKILSIAILHFTWFTLTDGRMTKEGRWECYSIYIEQNCFSYFLSNQCTQPFQYCSFAR